MVKITLWLFSISGGLLIWVGCLWLPETPVTKTAVSPAIPPPVFDSQPTIVVIETISDVYYIPNTINIFFYANSWYYCCNDRWFVSSSYNGPWVYIAIHRLPVLLGQIPSKHIRPLPEKRKVKFSDDEDIDTD